MKGWSPANERFTDEEERFSGGRKLGIRIEREREGGRGTVKEIKQVVVGGRSSALGNRKRGERG